VLSNDKDKVVSHLFHSLDEGKKIAVATMSPAQAQDMGKVIKKRYPDLNVLVLWKDTNIKLKNQVFEEMECLKDYDVVLYSPTCKVGVSFEEEHFDCVYAFNHSMSDLSTEDFRQMIRRIRQTRDNVVYCCISQTKSKNAPTSKRTIEKELGASAYFGVHEYNEQGNKIFPYKDFYYYAHLLNQHEKNVSSSWFLPYFIYQILKDGDTITAFPDEYDSGMGKEVRKKMKVEAVERKDDERNKIASAPCIDDTTAKAIKADMEMGCEVEEKDVSSVKKKHLQTIMM
jgi:hypothetical protein